MKVVVFGYNPFVMSKDVRDIKADICRQLKEGTGLLIIDERIKLQGVIDLTEKDCKQFGVAIGAIGERGNH